MGEDQHDRRLSAARFSEERVTAAQREIDDDMELDFDVREALIERGEQMHREIKSVRAAVLTRLQLASIGSALGDFTSADGIEGRPAEAFDQLIRSAAAEHAAYAHTGAREAAQEAARRTTWLDVAAAAFQRLDDSNERALCLPTVISARSGTEAIARLVRRDAPDDLRAAADLAANVLWTLSRDCDAVQERIDVHPETDYLWDLHENDRAGVMARSALGAKARLLVEAATELDDARQALASVGQSHLLDPVRIADLAVGTHELLMDLSYILVVVGCDCQPRLE